jgi:hypothetical protein
VEGGGTKSDHGWLWRLWWRWRHYGFCIGVQCAAGIPDWLGQWQQRRGGLGGLPDPSSLDVLLTLTLTLTGWNVFFTKKKMNGRKWIMVLSYFLQKQCFSAR